MEKVMSYIRQGKGRGLLFLLAASVLVTTLTMFTLKGIYNELRPDIMLVASEFLPITVQDGKIVDPANTYKRLDLDLGDGNKKEDIFPIVLDTRSETSAVPTEGAGLFITTDTVYMVTANQIRRFSPNDGVLNKDNFQQTLNNVVGYFSVFMSILAIVTIFLMYLLKTWLAALVGNWGQKLMKKPEMFNFTALMRLNAVLVAAVELLSFAIGWYGGWAVNGFQAFLIVVVLELLFLYREKTQEA